LYIVKEWYVDGGPYLTLCVLSRAPNIDEYSRAFCPTLSKCIVHANGFDALLVHYELVQLVGQ
jgi:hypothetical protein